MEVRRLLLKILHRAGYTLVPNRCVEHYAAATFLRRLFALLDIDCVLDVGANIGETRDFLRDQVGYAGWIVSFEPIPAHVELLRTRAASDPRWTIEGYALGSTPGHATFNVMSHTEFSSFLFPDHSRVEMFKDLNEVRQQVPVPVETLDRILPGLEGRLGAKHLYLKLDTQGFDLEVIKGSRASLPSIRALQTETSVVPIYAGMPDYVTAIKTLNDLGFVLSGVFHNVPQIFPWLIELDCYMINRAYMPPSRATSAGLP